MRGHHEHRRGPRRKRHAGRHRRADAGAAALGRELRRRPRDASRRRAAGTQRPALDDRGSRARAGAALAPRGGGPGAAAALGGAAAARDAGHRGVQRAALCRSGAPPRRDHGHPVRNGAADDPRGGATDRRAGAHAPRGRRRGRRAGRRRAGRPGGRRVGGHDRPRRNRLHPGRRARVDRLHDRDTGVAPRRAADAGAGDAGGDRRADDAARPAGRRDRRRARAPRDGRGGCLPCARRLDRRLLALAAGRGPARRAAGGAVPESHPGLRRGAGRAAAGRAGGRRSTAWVSWSRAWPRRSCAAERSGPVPLRSRPATPRAPACRPRPRPWPAACAAGRQGAASAGRAGRAPRSSRRAAG